MRKNYSASCRDLQQYRFFNKVCHVPELADGRWIGCEEQAIHPTAKHGRLSGMGNRNLGGAGEENNVSSDQVLAMSIKG